MSQPLATRWLDATHPASSITPHASFQHLSHHVGTFLITFQDMNKRRGGAKPFRCAFAINHKNSGPSTPSQLKSHIHGKVYAHKAFSNTYPNYQRGRYGCVMLNQHCAYVICGYVNGIEKDMVMMNSTEADGTEKQHPSYALSVGATYLISFFCSSIYATVITHMSYLQTQIDSQSLQVDVTAHEEMNVNKRFLYKSKNNNSGSASAPTSPSTSPQAKTERLSPRPPSTPTETSRSLKHPQPQTTLDLSMPTMGQRAQSLPVRQTQTNGLNIPTLKRKTTEETTPTHELASQKRFRNSLTSASSNDPTNVDAPPIMSRHTTDPLTSQSHHSSTRNSSRNRQISQSSDDSILGYDVATLDALRNAVSGLDSITTSTSQYIPNTIPQSHPSLESSKPQPPLPLPSLPPLQPLPQPQFQKLQTQPSTSTSSNHFTLPSLQSTFPSPSTSSQSSMNSSLSIPTSQRLTSADTFPDASSYYEYKSLVHNYGNFNMDVPISSSHHETLSTTTSYHIPSSSLSHAPNSHEFILPTLQTPFASALTSSYMPPMTPMTPLPSTLEQH